MGPMGRGASHLITVLSILFLAHPSLALVLSSPQNPYYGKAFYEQVARGERDERLVTTIRDILSKKHSKREGQLDEISDRCVSNSCYMHTPVGYKTAREKLMGELHLVKEGSQFGVLDVYCEKTFVEGDFGDNERTPGPNRIPDDKIVNAEHTWPQSRFNSNASRETQKCDLHHLFPTDHQMNGIRGNLKFGEVDRPRQALKCPISKIGQVAGAPGEFFEPPDRHKGNVARALFYFSIRYQLRIEPSEEKFLKRWNQEDPVDEEERARNERIMQIQGNRNPFVDYPELADAISDF